MKRDTDLYRHVLVNARTRKPASVYLADGPGGAKGEAVLYTALEAVEALRLLDKGVVVMTLGEWEKSLCGG